MSSYILVHCILFTALNTTVSFCLVALSYSLLVSLLFSYLPTKPNRRIKANAREVEALLRGIITKRETAMKNGHADDSDLLGKLMQSNVEEAHGGGGSSKPMMTMEDIIGGLKLFYFAGMETTSALLAWTLIVLSMHPEWQDRAREEVLEVFGKNEPNINGTNSLKVVGNLRKGNYYTILLK